MSKAIILRKLDTLTTAESVVKALSVAIPDLMNKISAIIIGKDQLTGVSRGVCYLKVESIVDALVVKDALTNRPTPIKIDGKAGKSPYIPSHLEITFFHHLFSANCVL